MNVENLKGIKEIIEVTNKKEDPAPWNPAEKNLDSADPYTSKKENIEANIIDSEYGKILGGILPQSDSEEELNQSENIKKVIELSMEDGGSIDDIIKDLENGQSPISPTRKQVLNRNSGGGNKGASSNSFDTKDTSQENSEWKKSIFSKLTENVISNSYTEQKNVRSCLSPQLLAVRNVKTD